MYNGAQDYANIGKDEDKNMARQSLKQAKVLVKKGTLKLRCGLAGCPVGAWPQTDQARRALANELPHSSERTYTVTEFVEAIYPGPRRKVSGLGRILLSPGRSRCSRAKGEL